MNIKMDKVYQSIKKGKFKIKTIRKKNDSHILVCGDCLDVTKFIPDRSIDLIITDPPYNRGLDYGKDFDDDKHWGEYYSVIKRRLEDIPRMLKKTGSFYLISYPEINARLLPFIEDILKLKFRRWLTWHYPTNLGHSNKNFTRSQRSILFFTKSDDYIFNKDDIIQHYKNPEVARIKERIKHGSKGRTSYDLLRYLDLIELSKGMIDVFDINLLKNVSKDRLNKKHPCQLPLALLKTLVKASSNKGDTILDPFAGTFTLSAVAAELKRNSIGIEKNPNYLKLGLKRLKK